METYWTRVFAPDRPREPISPLFTQRCEPPRHRFAVGPEPTLERLVAAAETGWRTIRPSAFVESGRAGLSAPCSENAEPRGARGSSPDNRQNITR